VGERQNELSRTETTQVTAASRREAGAQKSDGEQRGSAEEHERRIEGLRDELASAVDEIERRAREAANVKLQMRRHPGIVIGAGLVILAIGVGIISAIARSRSTSVRARRLVNALATLRSHPERLAAPTPSPARKALAAVFAAAGTTAARQMVRRVMARERVRVEHVRRVESPPPT
jgi:hypothetical protein